MLKLVVVAALAAAPFSAALAQSVDPVAYEAVAKGQFAAAEARLTAEVARGSREPGVLLNLASIYARTSRTGDAATIYRRVAALENVQMEMADGSPAWSHDLAALGLSRLTALSSLGR